ncbi:MAG TPA: VOC family protein [Agriterribacter sp.]|nr:VOC family protein [Agriterribacter sp.]
MTTVNVYLTFNGNCEEAFNFYKSVFGGEFQYLGRFSEMPADPNNPKVSEEEGNKIMHVSLPVGAGTILMGSDSSTAFGQKIVSGNNFSISVNTDKNEEADRLFKALSEKGNVTMPMSQTFWGSYFGMLTDQFGINWMISVEGKPAS